MNERDARQIERALNTVRRFSQDNLPESFRTHFEDPIAAISAYMTFPDISDEQVRFLADEVGDRLPINLPKFATFEQWRNEFQKTLDYFRQIPETSEINKYYKNKYASVYNVLDTLTKYAEHTNGVFYREGLVGGSGRSDGQLVASAVTYGSEMARQITAVSRDQAAVNSQLINALVRCCNRGGGGTRGTFGFWSGRGGGGGDDGYDDDGGGPSHKRLRNDEDGASNGGGGDSGDDGYGGGSDARRRLFKPPPPPDDQNNTSPQRRPPPGSGGGAFRMDIDVQNDDASLLNINTNDRGDNNQPPPPPPAATAALVTTVQEQADNLSAIINTLTNSTLPAISETTRAQTELVNHLANASTNYENTLAKTMMELKYLQPEQIQTAVDGAMRTTFSELGKQFSNDRVIDEVSERLKQFVTSDINFARGGGDDVGGGSGGASASDELVKVRRWAEEMSRDIMKKTKDLREVVDEDRLKNTLNNVLGTAIENMREIVVSQKNVVEKSLDQPMQKLIATVEEAKAAVDPANTMVDVTGSLQPTIEKLESAFGTPLQDTVKQIVMDNALQSAKLADEAVTQVANTGLDALNAATARFDQVAAKISDRDAVLLEIQRLLASREQPIIVSREQPIKTVRKIKKFDVLRGVDIRRRKRKRNKDKPTLRVRPMVRSFPTTSDTVRDPFVFNSAAITTIKGVNDFPAAPQNVTLMAASAMAPFGTNGDLSVIPSTSASVAVGVPALNSASASQVVVSEEGVATAAAAVAVESDVTTGDGTTGVEESVETTAMDTRKPQRGQSELTVPLSIVKFLEPPPERTQEDSDDNYNSRSSASPSSDGEETDDQSKKEARKTARLNRNSAAGTAKKKKKSPPDPAIKMSRRRSASSEEDVEEIGRRAAIKKTRREVEEEVEEGQEQQSMELIVDEASQRLNEVYDSIEPLRPDAKDDVNLRNLKDYIALIYVRHGSEPNFPHDELQELIGELRLNGDNKIVLTRLCDEALAINESLEAMEANDDIASESDVNDDIESDETLKEDFEEDSYLPLDIGGSNVQHYDEEEDVFASVPLFETDNDAAMAGVDDTVADQDVSVDATGSEALTRLEDELAPAADDEFDTVDDRRREVTETAALPTELLRDLRAKVLEKPRYAFPYDHDSAELVRPAVKLQNERLTRFLDDVFSRETVTNACKIALERFLEYKRSTRYYQNCEPQAFGKGMARNVVLTRMVISFPLVYDPVQTPIRNYLEEYGYGFMNDQYGSRNHLNHYFNNFPPVEPTTCGLVPYEETLSYAEFQQYRDKLGEAFVDTVPQPTGFYQGAGFKAYYVANTKNEPTVDPELFYPMYTTFADFQLCPSAPVTSVTIDGTPVEVLGQGEEGLNHLVEHTSPAETIPFPWYNTKLLRKRAYCPSNFTYMVVNGSEAGRHYFGFIVPLKDFEAEPFYARAPVEKEKTLYLTWKE